MQIIETALNGALNWFPFAITFIIGFFLLYFLNKIFQNRIQASESINKLYYQLTIFILANLFVIALIIESPLSENIKSQLISLLGISFTAAIALSSTTFLGNLMAGLMLKVLNKMRPGDFVSIESNFGRVTELGLLHTEIQSQDRDLITLPNLYLVSNPVKVIRHSGTFISDEVSLGYDIHHNKIEDSLIKAAQNTNLEDPFVYITKLGDFSVTYKVHGFLKDIKSILSSKSKLRENILDALHADGIEIVSPTFMNQRVLTQENLFIARYQKDSATAAERPEDIIFDKAQEAETLENLKLKIDQINLELKDEEKTLTDERIQYLKRRLETLNNVIKSRSKSTNDQK